MAEVDAPADGGHPDGPDGPDPSGDGDRAVGARRAARQARVRTSKSRRRVVVVLAVLAALIVVPLLGVGGWFWYQVDPPGDPGEEVTVEIGAGWGTQEIADELARRGVVGSSFAFQVYSRLAGKGPFQAGTYTLRKDSGARAAADALERAPEQVYHRLALPPGLTLAMIAERVGRLPGLSAERFLQAAASGQVRSQYQPAGVTSLEGLTWPDTYNVAEHEDELAVLTTLVREFDERATALGLGQSSDPYHAITVASLIQTEAKIDGERPQIAAVVENRLAADMPLQIDATVIYARAHAGGPHEGPLRTVDFERDSPYNTYRVRGLPPTPISTVSAASLEAALAPADVPYLFYVLIDDEGHHRFAVTYEEHERNVAEARRKGVIG